MDTSAEGCTFCKILQKELEASFVYEDELVAAFLDIEPINAGHVLVVPRDHAVHLADVRADTFSHMAFIGQKIAQAIRASEVQADGINLILADGEAAGQEVWHVHLHVVPRFPADGFSFQMQSSNPSRSELDGVATMLRRLL